jgi:hypothetical protein
VRFFFSLLLFLNLISFFLFLSLSSQTIRTNRSRTPEDVEKANEEALRLALHLSMQEVNEDLLLYQQQQQQYPEQRQSKRRSQEQDVEFSAIYARRSSSSASSSSSVATSITTTANPHFFSQTAILKEIYEKKKQSSPQQQHQQQQHSQQQSNSSNNNMSVLSNQSSNVSSQVYHSSSEMLGGGKGEEGTIDGSGGEKALHRHQSYQFPSRNNSPLPTMDDYLGYATSSSTTSSAIPSGRQSTRPLNSSHSASPSPQPFQMFPNHVMASSHPFPSYPQPLTVRNISNISNISNDTFYSNDSSLFPSESVDSSSHARRTRRLKRVVLSPGDASKPGRSGLLYN